MDIFEFLKYLGESAPAGISFEFILISAGITLFMYLILFLIRRFIMKVVLKVNFIEFIVKFSIAFVVEFVLIWLYGGKIVLLAIVLGMLLALYIKNKLFNFLVVPETMEHDMDVKLELSVLRSKFKKNPHYSILEVLLYYGYISELQKEAAETANIFMTPDEIAKEMLNKPMLTTEQLDEAIGIMNMIRREGKVLTREEALLLIMQIRCQADNSQNGNNETNQSGNTNSSST